MHVIERDEHWWCPDCGAFDGPITDGCCDVCDPLDGHSQGVQRLVPATDLGAVDADAVADVRRTLERIANREVYYESMPNIAAAALDRLSGGQ